MYFKGKRILITGGTGSFGQLAVERLLDSDPLEVRIFSRGEKKQYEMKQRLADPRATYVLGDIRDLEAMRAALRGIEVVFHAAALKYVPYCEFNVYETILTNVIGSANLMRACKEARVGVVVALSTDKAVMPVNAYGMSKALMERLFINANIDLGGFPTRFVSVRYGNVIGSSGSVIPFFQSQIENGGPVTVTDTQMTRFWFTLSEAVNLAFNAAAIGKGGEVFVKRIPAARLTDLAEVLIGARNIEVQSIGIRPGEKLHELLVSENEALRAVEMYDGYVILPQIPLGLESFYGKPGGQVGAYSSQDVLMDKVELVALLDRAGWL